MDHRLAVESALNAQPRKTSTDEVVLSQPTSTEPSDPGPAPQQPISMRTIWIYFGAVGVIALFALLRALSRRWKGHCGPVG